MIAFSDSFKSNLSASFVFEINLIPFGREGGTSSSEKRYTFLLAAKSSVKKGDDQNPVYFWLSSKQQNGWNDSAPTWYFGKYLIDENGKLVDVVNPKNKPYSDKILDWVKK